MPKVSVLLPTHNAARHLPSALASLLAQTWEDFELLVMDDGSVDGTAGIVAEVAGQDRRVRLFRRPHRGLVATLNELVAHAQAPYIARMDADDIARPERLAQQVAHMDGHPRTGVLGCWVQTFGERTEVWHFRRWDNYSRNLMLFGVTVLCHPSWMVRRTLYERHPYDEAFCHIEDREWLARVAATEREVEFVALPRVLLDYRVHADSVTGRHQAAQQARTGTIVARLLAAYGCPLSAPELEQFMRVAFTRQCRADEIEPTGHLLRRISAEVGRQLPDEHRVFREYWLKFCACNRVARDLANALFPAADFQFLHYRELEPGTAHAVT